MNALRAVRKLLLGETVALPVGIAVTVLIAAGLRVAVGPGGWWRDGGGLVLAAGLIIALAVSVLGLRR